MTNEQYIASNWTRRDAVAGIAGTLASVTVPSLGSAASDDLHLTVAHRVRELTQGRALTLQILLPHGSGGNVGPVIAEFRSLTGVEVSVTETQVDEINTELILNSLSRSGKYDIALPATFGIPDLVSVGAIRPLTEWADRYEPEGFRDQILYGVGDSYDGQLYGFQADGDAYLMFYNKRFLENRDEAARYADTYGTALAPPETWAELDQQMAYFNRPEKGQWGGLLFRAPGYLAWEWWVRFHAKGVWPFSPEMEPQIDSDSGIDALVEMIHATDSLCPEAFASGLFENWERYSRGDIYCNIGWGGSQKYLNGPASVMRDNMIYRPMPGGIVNGKLLVTPYFNWGWNYVVSQNSEFPEISYLFALFASTPEMSTLAVRNKDGFFDPYRPEHYQDPGIRSAYSKDFLDVHRASLEMAIPNLYLKAQEEYFRVLTEGLHDALQRKASPKVALERVAKRWRLITNSAGLRSQIERWTRLRQKYPAQIRNALRDLN